MGSRPELLKRSRVLAWFWYLKHASLRCRPYGSMFALSKPKDLTSFAYRETPLQHRPSSEEICGEVLWSSCITGNGWRMFRTAALNVSRDAPQFAPWAGKVSLNTLAPTSRNLAHDQLLRAYRYTSR